MKRSTFVTSLLSLIATPVLAFQQKEPAEWVKKHAKGPKRLTWIIRESVVIDGITASNIDPLWKRARAIQDAKARIFHQVDQHIRIWDMRDSNNRVVVNLRLDIVAYEKHSEILRALKDINGKPLFTE